MEFHKQANISKFDVVQGQINDIIYLIKLYAHIAKGTSSKDLLTWQ